MKNSIQEYPGQTVYFQGVRLGTIATVEWRKTQRHNTPKPIFRMEEDPAGIAELCGSSNPGMDFDS